jgi:hypothetical protein
MESPREANNHSANQQIPRLLWNEKVHYRVHKSPPMVPILRQMHPVQIFHHISLRYILILYSNLRLGLPSGLFSSGYPIKILYAFLTSPMRATCPAHLILLHMITLIILSEACKLWSSSLFSLLHPSATFSRLDLNILPSTLFSYIPNLCVSD